MLATDVLLKFHSMGGNVDVIYLLVVYVGRGVGASTLTLLSALFFILQTGINFPLQLVLYNYKCLMHSELNGLEAYYKNSHRVCCKRIASKLVPGVELCAAVIRVLYIHST